jgi:hypothetical protein
MLEEVGWELLMFIGYGVGFPSGIQHPGGNIGCPIIKEHLVIFNSPSAQGIVEKTDIKNGISLFMEFTI